jgi:diamine N-acetyltransferase
LVSGTFVDRLGRAVTLAEIDEENWRAVADVAPRDEQRRFVAALGARYLLLSMREDVWHSLAIVVGKSAAGHVMWARDDDAYWVGGMIVDAAEQGNGVGRAAMEAVVERLAAMPDAREVRLSCHPENTGAERLYRALGFSPSGEFEDDEVVMARKI